MRIVVTGGAGFAGSAACRHFVGSCGHTVLNLDHAIDAASRFALQSVAASPRYTMRRADICDRSRVRALLEAFEADAVVHIAHDNRADERAAETSGYIKTNVVGTYALLEAVKDYWSNLSEIRRGQFRYLQVSTSQAHDGRGTASGTPYAASMAAADNLAMAWHNTYGLPVIVAAPSTLYGPYQCPERLIAKTVIAAINSTAFDTETSSGYGTAREADGSEVTHDWLHVEDFARALEAMLAKGTPGAKYLLGGGSARSQSAVGERIAALIGRHSGRTDGKHEGSLTTVARLASIAREDTEPAASIDCSPLQRDTGWRPQETLESGLSHTVRWFLANEAWWRAIIDARTEHQRHGMLLRA